MDPNVILHYDLSGNALKVYAYYLMSTGDFGCVENPCMKKAQTDLGMSRTTFWRARCELEANELLFMAQRCNTPSIFMGNSKITALKHFNTTTEGTV